MVCGVDSATTNTEHLEPTQQRKTDISAESGEDRHLCLGPQPGEKGRKGEKNLNCLSISSKEAVQLKTPKCFKLAKSNLSPLLKKIIESCIRLLEVP